MPKDVWPHVQVPGTTFGIQSLNSYLKGFKTCKAEVNSWKSFQLDLSFFLHLTSHHISPFSSKKASSHSTLEMSLTTFVVENTFVDGNIQGILAQINSCQKGKMTINQRTYITYRPLRMECFGEIRVRPKDALEIIAIFHSSRASI